MTGHGTDPNIYAVEWVSAASREPCPARSAHALSDSDLLHQCRELPVLLGQAARANGADGSPCPPTGVSPAVGWAGRSRANWSWALAHAGALHTAHYERFGQYPESYPGLEWALSVPLAVFRDLAPEWPIADVPGPCRNDEDPVSANRAAVVRREAHLSERSRLMEAAGLLSRPPRSPAARPEWTDPGERPDWQPHQRWWLTETEREAVLRWGTADRSKSASAFARSHEVQLAGLLGLRVVASVRQAMGGRVP